ncbi:hypothetical protein X777_09444, partial [Ooceraea biroi]
SFVSVEFNISNEGKKYRESVSRDYSKFHIGEFLKAVEERIEHRDDLDVNVRAKKFVQNMVDALDMVAPKKKCKIPNIWEGKKWYSDDIRIARNKRDEAYSRAVHTGNNKGIIGNFEPIDVHKLQRIIMNLPRKKGTEEGITSDILKASFYVMKKELVKVINDSLSKGICPKGWKISTIISIPKVEKPKKASEYWEIEWRRGLRFGHLVARE